MGKTTDHSTGAVAFSPTETKLGGGKGPGTTGQTRQYFQTSSPECPAVSGNLVRMDDNEDEDDNKEENSKNIVVKSN